MSRVEELRRIEAAISQIQRSIMGRDAARRRAERAGVTVGRPAVSILAALHREGPLRPGDLARHTELEAPLISREVRSLVDGGYVSRAADPGDGRASIVALTPLGEATFGAYRAATDDIVIETFRSWSRADLGTLAELLERVQHDVAKWDR